MFTRSKKLYTHFKIIISNYFSAYNIENLEPLCSIFRVLFKEKKNPYPYCPSVCMSVCQDPLSQERFYFYTFLDKKIWPFISQKTRISQYKENQERI